MDKKINKSILLNLNAEDYKIIKEQADKNRMTVFAYIRYVLILKK